MPPARVNVYAVFGAQDRTRVQQREPVSPSSQTIRQGASGPALNAASRLQDGIGRFTEKRPTDRARVDGTVELHGDRGVSGNPDGSAVRDQLDDLRRARETPRERRDDHPGRAQERGPANAVGETAARSGASTRG